MTENQALIERLQKLMAQKKSKKFYAERLGISTDKINVLLEQVKKGVIAANNESEVANYISLLEEKVLKFDENMKDETAEVVAKVKDQIKTLDELIQKCNIDTKTWNIDRYVQNYWGTDEMPHWQVKVWLSKKTPVDNFHKNFIDFLKNYSPKIQHVPARMATGAISKGCLIINKQDQHLNKFDIGGENSIQKRFDEILEATKSTLRAASFSNQLDKIYYVVGSDQFNSEWTGTTTRGTKMENVDTFHNSFEAICDHELNMINLLEAHCKDVEILYVSGNHDEHIGWHLINWLKAMFRYFKNITFDTSPRYRKYARYGNTALMFNHGDAIKPEKLAAIFPQEFKDQWSACKHYMIMTGDKHHELSRDLNGIKFYQIPALSKAKSFWDDKNGYTCSAAELSVFAIDEKFGLTAIFKRPI